MKSSSTQNGIEPLALLEALARNQRLRVDPDNRSVIVAKILHYIMWPYFLNRTAEMQEKFSEADYRAYMKALEDYCLREYINHPDPRMTIDFIKGLHRQFYSNVSRVPVRTVEGGIMTMVPGELRNKPSYVHVSGVLYKTLIQPEDIQQKLDNTLNALVSIEAPLFERYLYFIFNFSVIHPFIDGNGKMSLALGDLYLLKQGVRPPFFAKYWMASRPHSDNRIVQYALYPHRRDLSDLYPAILYLYWQDGIR